MRFGLQEHYEEYWNRPCIYANRDPLAHKRQELLFKSLQVQALSSGRLLEIGCGEGDLCSLASSKGFAPLGTDIAPSAVERAAVRHPTIDFQVLDVESLPWQTLGHDYDVVVSFEVIEHLLHPRSLIIGAHQSLKPGGLLALTTPYHGRAKNVAISLIDFDRHFQQEGDHIRFFTDRSLRKLLRSEGFSVLRIAHFGRVPLLWSGVFVFAQKR